MVDSFSFLMLVVLL
uniref:Uncharacterized protein n=1 Tax=Rhizophora mucronata TaxID=61149 RepID=A0A2P2KHJ6_RHIMU